MVVVDAIVDELKIDAGGAFSVDGSMSLLIMTSVSMMNNNAILYGGGMQIISLHIYEFVILHNFILEKSKSVIALFAKFMKKIQSIMTVAMSLGGAVQNWYSVQSTISNNTAYFGGDSTTL